MSITHKYCGFAMPVIVTTLVALFANTLDANASGDLNTTASGDSSSVSLRKACEWSEEDVFVIPGTVTDKEQKVIDKLLDALEKAVGGAVPQIGAVKTAIDKLGPGKDVVDVVVIYTCTDNAGKIHRKRATLDGQTEAVLWAAKMNLAKGSAKADRDRERQKAINNHKPKISCCPPKAPPGQAQPGTNPPGINPQGPKPPTPATADPCKVPPPCPACKTHYDKIVAGCDRIKEIDDQLPNIEFQLKAFKDRLETATGTELTKLNGQITEFNADKQKLSSEKAGLRTEIKNDTDKMRACEKTRCEKTVTGGGIDSCLVGNWRSESMVSEVGYSGGAGIVLTIKADGTETIDYNGMQPIKGNGETHLWQGIVEAHITTSKGTATVTSADKTDLTVKETFADGHTSNRTTKALGPATLGNYPTDRSYTCDGTTLTFKGVIYTVTFKREKKAP